MSPRLINSLDALESQQSWEYNDGIRLLEADLMDRNVSMTSLTLEEIRALFNETAAARIEHMNRAMASNAPSWSGGQGCTWREQESLRRVVGQSPLRFAWPSHPPPCEPE